MEACLQSPSCPGSQEQSSHPGNYVESSSAAVCSPTNLLADSGQMGLVTLFHLHVSYLRE